VRLNFLKSEICSIKWIIPTWLWNVVYRAKLLFP